MANPKPMTAEVFWQRVLVRGADECWPWSAGKDRCGYGKTSRHLAHRMAFFFEHGRWPRPCCCHRCDNPACCNPAHLFEGTIAENARDRMVKGRGTRGASQPGAKLTDQDVRDIRANFTLCRVTADELAERFGVSKNRIWAIVRRESWRHVP